MLSLRLVARLASYLLLLLAFAPAVHAQNKCSASGSMGSEKFTATHCAATWYEHSVALWFSDNPISADEEQTFQVSASADDKKDGKERTLVVVMFCPGGGAETASASAVKMIDLHTNHAKSGFLGVQTVVDAPHDLKVEKLSGQVKAGAALSGKITATAGQTTVNLDFDVKLPAKEAAAGMGCGG
jgi:hypothetical protein